MIKSKLIFKKIFFFRILLKVLLIIKLIFYKNLKL